MTHKYTVTGMTCGGCEAKVKSNLLKMPDVLSAAVSKENSTAVIEMGKHISVEQFQEALGGQESKYQIREEKHEIKNQHAAMQGEAAASVSWVQTYKPILLIFGYIIGVTLLAQVNAVKFDSMQWMRQFMASFFLVFSFFKLLNLKGFAESYAMYDVIAKSWKGWGFVYAFLELFLGVAFLLNFQPLMINVLTLIVMLVSIVGVLQSVLNKRKIKCACLGDVFNLPMSTVTIIEDGLMILMSAAMIFMLF